MRSLEMCEQEYVEKYYPQKLVLGSGLSDPKIMLIGEAPGANEEQQGKPFVGKAGKNLDEFLKVAGILRNEVYITNVVKFRPSKPSPKTGKLINRPPTKEEIDVFLPLLRLEIREINPGIIVTLGNIPLRAVTGNPKALIGDMHGEMTEVEGFKLFPMYHPAAVIYNQSLRDVYLEDLEKIKGYI